jgi:hypothetical protein
MQSVITSALRKIGVIEPTDIPDSTTLSNVAVSLNLMIKQWATDGLKLWKNSELMIPLTSGQTQYKLGDTGSDIMYDVTLTASPALITDKPLKAIQGFYRNVQVTPNIDTPVLLLSKQEYLVLGNKYSTGTVNSFFYDPKSTYGILNLYLTPDTLSQTNLQFHMVAQMHINDLTNQSDIPDFPIEWNNALVWNLADQIAIEYGVPQNYRQEIMMRARAYKDEVSSFDVDYTSTYFQPDYRNVNPSSYSR